MEQGVEDEGGDVLAKGLRVLAAVRVEPLVDPVGRAEAGVDVDGGGGGEGDAGRRL